MKQFLLSRTRSIGLFLVFPLNVILAGSVAPLWAQGQPARFAYVSNDNSSGISAYAINQTTGALNRFQAHHSARVTTHSQTRRGPLGYRKEVADGRENVVFWLR